MLEFHNLKFPLHPLKTILFADILEIQNFQFFTLNRKSQRLIGLLIVIFLLIPHPLHPNNFLHPHFLLDLFILKIRISPHCLLPLQALALWIETLSFLANLLLLPVILIPIVVYYNLFLKLKFHSVFVDYLYQFPLPHWIHLFCYSIPHQIYFPIIQLFAIFLQFSPLLYPFI